MFVFRVNDMSCDHCVAAISEAVKSVDASARAEVDLGLHLVRIESARDAAAFRAAIADAGYTPELV